MKKTTIAYLAGLVDGEGYVGIKKSLNGMKHNRQKSPSYHERIQIRMIDEPAIKLFADIFGGNYYKETENSKYSKRPLYCYQISDLSAAKTLKILLPYLIIKKKQASLCLKLRKNKESKLAQKRGNGHSMSLKSLEYRDNLWKQIKIIHSKKK